MLQTIISTIIIALCAFFVGRRLYRQFKSAVDPNKTISCSCSCPDCSVSSCDSKEQSS
ncbi:FeoB-associated Cys-rich membrane protein [Desulfopila sp. IMCC35008]|uniref:FeoB-associated Cys-rich membrane protein n=1 Tax=Desulfopila sp. IMCC35008 TaxID=2653858 RepID=UPI0013D81FFE